MTDLTETLRLHALWLGGDPVGVRADLSRTDLIGANLRRANLRRADLIGADLRGANLHLADLTEAYLIGADLTEADLIGANLTGADLTRADLSEANLHLADLSRTDLTEADLSRTDLIGANLYRAIGIILLGTPDGWFSYAWLREGWLSIRVGCKELRLTEARAYWCPSHPEWKRRREVAAAVEYAASVAKLRGWPLTKEEVKPGQNPPQPPVNTATVS